MLVALLQDLASVYRVNLPSGPSDQTKNIYAHPLHGRPGLKLVGTLVSLKHLALFGRTERCVTTELAAPRAKAIGHVFALWVPL